MILREHHEEVAVTINEVFSYFLRSTFNSIRALLSLSIGHEDVLRVSDVLFELNVVKERIHAAHC
jgi:hypothetical protein